TGPDHAARTRTVLWHDRLTKTFAQPQREVSPGGVDDAAGNVGQDEVDWLAGVSLRPQPRRREHSRADQRRRCKAIDAHFSSAKFKYLCNSSILANRLRCIHKLTRKARVGFFRLRSYRSRASTRRREQGAYPLGHSF